MECSQMLRVVTGAYGLAEQLVTPWFHCLCLDVQQVHGLHEAAYEWLKGCMFCEFDDRSSYEQVLINVDGSGGSKVDADTYGLASWSFNVVSCTGGRYAFHGYACGTLEQSKPFLPIGTLDSNSAEMVAMIWA
eukprot:11320170-Karenia_brevis.AAC.1